MRHGNGCSGTFLRKMLWCPFRKGATSTAQGHCKETTGPITRTRGRVKRRSLKRKCPLTKGSFINGVKQSRFGSVSFWCGKLTHVQLACKPKGPRTGEGKPFLRRIEEISLNVQSCDSASVGCQTPFIIAKFTTAHGFAGSRPCKTAQDSHGTGIVLRIPSGESSPVPRWRGGAGWASPTLVSPPSPAHQGAGHAPYRESRCVVGLQLQQGPVAWTLLPVSSWLQGLKEAGSSPAPVCEGGEAGQGSFDAGDAARRGPFSK